MKGPVHGKLISTNLGEFAKRKIKYGYVGLQLNDKSHIKVKVDAYTWYETLTIGDEVVVEIETLTGTDILVARKIQLKTGIETPPDEAAATA